MRSEISFQPGAILRSDLYAVANTSEMVRLGEG